MEKPVLQIENSYGNRIRVRVCGICLREGKILLVNHKLYLNHDFWSPPGGGLEFGETASEAVEREVREETGLLVKVENFLFVEEYVNPPLHTVEIFFQCNVVSGELCKGIDPEFRTEDQIISEVKWMTLEDLNSVKPEARHAIFSSLTTWDNFLKRKGFSGYIIN